MVTALEKFRHEEIERREDFMPALSIESAVNRFRLVKEFVEKVMHKDVDYGVIPGTDKPTLLKPGAEKLCTLFGLTTRFTIIEKVEDWTGKDHNGEPFFYYLYRCQLWRGDHLITEADGSCSTFESKYRWRKMERVCPSCGVAAIIKGKEDYGGGWLCFKKKGGCGEKFRDGDQNIESQQVGRVANADICDQVNTIQKMSQKRGLVAATLLGVNASEFFTQDLEDLSQRPQTKRERFIARIQELLSADLLTEQEIENFGKKIAARIQELQKQALDEQQPIDVQAEPVTEPPPEPVQEEKPAPAKNGGRHLKLLAQYERLIKDEPANAISVYLQNKWGKDTPDKLTEQQLEVEIAMLKVDEKK